MLEGIYVFSDHSARKELMLVHWNHISTFAKRGDVRKHLFRNNVAPRCSATNDAADPSPSRTGCCSYVYRRTSAKSCWEVCANVQPCQGKLAFLRTRRAGRGRCCFRRNSRTYGFALLNFSPVDAVPAATDDIIRFSRIGVSMLASFMTAATVLPFRDGIYARNSSIYFCFMQIRGIYETRLHLHPAQDPSINGI